EPVGTAAAVRAAGDRRGRRRLRPGVAGGGRAAAGVRVRGRAHVVLDRSRHGRCRGVGAGWCPMSAAVVFASSFAALYVAHSVGDHWVQTSCQAARKGCFGWSARWACVRHVATLTATKTVLLLVTLWVLDLSVSL